MNDSYEEKTTLTGDKRFGLQEINISGYIEYQVVDRTDNLACVYHTSNYNEAMDTLKAYNEEETSMERAEFVTKVGELLAIAKPNLVRCELMSGADIESAIEKGKMEYVYGRFRIPEDEYVVVSCGNGYHYEINVTMDSLGCIAEEVFTQMVCK